MYMARCRGNAKICLRLRAVTNLHSLGVDDKTIQGILRHSSWQRHRQSTSKLSPPMFKQP